MHFLLETLEKFVIQSPCFGLSAASVNIIANMIRKEMICSNFKIPALDSLSLVGLVHTKPIAVVVFDVTLVRLFTIGVITKHRDWSFFRPG